MYELYNQILILLTQYKKKLFTISLKRLYIIRTRYTLQLKLRNKDQQEALLSLIYFNNHLLHVSNRLNIHNREAVYCICSIWYLSCAYVA